MYLITTYLSSFIIIIIILGAYLTKENPKLDWIYFIFH